MTSLAAIHLSNSLRLSAHFNISPHPEEPCVARRAKRGVSKDVASTSRLAPRPRPSRQRFALPQGEGLGFGHASSLRVLSGHKARRSSLFLLPLKGRAERKTVRRIRGATCCRTQLMAPFTPNRCTAVCALAGHTIQQGRTTRGIGRRRSKPPAFRTRMDFAACCMSPGIAPFVGTPPGSNGLPPGHALGPSARRAGVCRPCPAAPGRSIRNPRSFRPGIVAATASSPAQ